MEAMEGNVCTYCVVDLEMKQSNQPKDVAT